MFSINYMLSFAQIEHSNVAQTKGVEVNYVSFSVRTKTLLNPSEMSVFPLNFQTMVLF